MSATALQKEQMTLRGRKADSGTWFETEEHRGTKWIGDLSPKQLPKCLVNLFRNRALEAASYPNKNFKIYAVLSPPQPFSIVHRTFGPKDSRNFVKNSVTFLAEAEEPSYPATNLVRF